MPTPDETLQTWNNIASLYQEKFMDLDLYNDTYDFICKAIATSNAKLLEIGCGPGNITKYLLSKRPDFNILGIDYAPNMIELAKKNNPTANFIVMDGRQINSLTSKYDGIIAGFCLPYLSNEECIELVVHSHDLLNANGLIYLSFVEGAPDDSEFKTGAGGRVYFHYHILEDLKKLLINNKFVDLTTFKIKYKRSETETEVHTVLIASKNKQ